MQRHRYCEPYSGYSVYTVLCIFVCINRQMSRLWSLICKCNRYCEHYSGYWMYLSYAYYIGNTWTLLWTLICKCSRLCEHYSGYYVYPSYVYLAYQDCRQSLPGSSAPDPDRTTDCPWTWLSQRKQNVHIKCDRALVWHPGTEAPTE